MSLFSSVTHLGSSPMIDLLLRPTTVHIRDTYKKT
jgi:hypothetical protein